MNFADAFKKAANNPIAKGVAVGAGIGLVAAALPVIGIVSGPVIGAAIGGYVANKRNQGPKQ